MDEDTSIREFLLAMREAMNQEGRCRPSWRFSCMADLLLQHGREFNSKPFPKGTPLRGGPKACFHNAGLLALGWPEKYLYCEGYATGIIPVHHAWVLDLEDGLVVDNTWTGEAGEEISTGRPTRGTQYFGIAFNREYLQLVVDRGHELSLLDQWQAGWPLLQGGPLGDAIEDAIDSRGFCG